MAPKIAAVTLLVILILAGSVSAQTSKPSAMKPAVDYSNAGISLAFPKGFKTVQCMDNAHIVRARTADPNGPAVAVTISAAATKKNISTSGFANAIIQDLRSQVTVRHFVVHKETPIVVAGSKGVALLYSFKFHAKGTTGADVFFSRDLADSPVRIFYLIRIEARSEHADQILPVLGKVVSSISFTPVRPATEDAVGPLGEAIEDAAKLYSLRPPLLWFIKRTDTGFVSGKMDYLLGGIPMPLFRVVSIPISSDANAESSSKAWLEQAKKGSMSMRLDTEVISEGATKLSGRDAYQFVIRQASINPKEFQYQVGEDAKSTIAAPAGSPSAHKSSFKKKTVTHIQRTISSITPEGENRAFTLVLRYPGEDTAGARAMFEELAAGFTLNEAPKTESIDLMKLK